MRRRAALLALAAALAPSVITTAPARAAGPPLAWLALGDSYASGEGLPGTPEPGDARPDCARATGEHAAAAWAVSAYRATARREPRLARQTFVACSGAITDDVTDQIAEATAATDLRQWDLVSLSFGGNNIKFADVVLGCIDLAHRWNPVDFTPGCDVDEARLRRRVDMLTGARPVDRHDYAGSLTLPRLYDIVAARVRPGGYVVVTGYPNLVEEVSRWDPWRRELLGACEGLEAYDIAMLRSVGGYLNQQIALAVEAANARHSQRGVHFMFADLARDVYETGDAANQRHGLCSAEPWLNGRTLGALSRDWRPIKSFHPNQAGHDASGAFVANLIRDHVDLAAIPAVREVTPETLRNARLPGDACGDGFWPGPGEPVLTDGKLNWKGPNGETISARGAAVGDLDRDGVADGALLLFCYPGGSAYSFAVLVYTAAGGYAGSVDYANGVPNRGMFAPGVESVGIDQERLVVRWSTYAGDDAHCCPSRDVTSTFTMNNRGTIVGGPVGIIDDEETVTRLVRAVSRRDLSAAHRIATPAAVARLVDMRDHLGGLRWSTSSRCLPYSDPTGKAERECYVGSNGGWTVSLLLTHPGFGSWMVVGLRDAGGGM